MLLFIRRTVALVVHRPGGAFFSRRELAWNVTGSVLLVKFECADGYERLEGGDDWTMIVQSFGRIRRASINEMKKTDSPNYQSGYFQLCWATPVRRCC